ncbi:hypothetical protein KCG44_04235 [Pacificimonas sp. WHA3]|uniref:Uncharacterized protein n=1 Tax=Pacificimonas pallii TaxID=2827236 RepID=A0ABS6SCM4_9SPHN|nr:hypothetical protein [Pacificimonas pallii]MBV7255990.1 hypothetical protein [Pacificimonas pallii]
MALVRQQCLSRGDGDRHQWFGCGVIGGRSAAQDEAGRQSLIVAAGVNFALSYILYLSKRSQQQTKIRESPHGRLTETLYVFRHWQKRNQAMGGFLEIFGAGGTAGLSLGDSNGFESRIVNIAASGDLQAAREFVTENPALKGNLEAALLDAGQFDTFHQLNANGADLAVIGTAREAIADGGCHSLGNGYMMCDPQGPQIGEFTIPQQTGFPNYIGPNARYSHHYEGSASAPDGGASLGREAVAELIVDPTPGEDRPATAAGTLNDAGIPLAGSNDMVRSYVATDISGNTVVANVTVPGQHILHPGIVSQSVSQTERSTTISVVGEGNGFWSIPANPIADATFQSKIDGDMRQAIYRDAQ